jgi:hypothetical protein
MSAALQKAIRDALTANADLTALVPAIAIMDRTGRPERFPCIILGEGQEVNADLMLDGDQLRAFVTLHVWSRDGSLVGVQQITRAIRSALKHGMGTLELGIMLDLRFESARFVRDPDGETSHAIVTFESLIEEAI